MLGALRPAGTAPRMGSKSFIHHSSFMVRLRVSIALPRTSTCSWYRKASASSAGSSADTERYGPRLRRLDEDGAGEAAGVGAAALSSASAGPAKARTTRTAGSALISLI